MAGGKPGIAPGESMQREARGKARARRGLRARYPPAEAGACRRRRALGARRRPRAMNRPNAPPGTRRERRGGFPGGAFPEAARWTSDIRYCMDSSGLDDFELAGRNAALRALVVVAPRLASVLVLNWLGGESSTVRAALQGLGNLVRTTDDRAEFVSLLAAAAGTATAERMLTVLTRQVHVRSKG